ncbi:MAG: hypothetical protein OEL20_16795 [Sulfuritalea sp.]|nr:hypothetical protein [Sulfuritalea sp.]
MPTLDGLEFYVDGGAFAEGRYDLRSVERLLSDYRRLVDQTLPLALGQKTLTRRIRNEVGYEISFKQGSWITLLEFAIEHKELLAAASAADGGTHFLADYISKLIHAVLELRRMFEERHSQGEKPRIQLASNNSVSVPIHLENVRTNGGNIIVSPVVVIAAEATRATLDSIIRAVDGTRIRNVSVRSRKTKSTITKEDLRITGTLKEELPNTLEVVGRLNVVAYDSHRGQLLTENGRFPVTWDERIRRDIHDFADTDGIAFVVKPVVDHRRFKEDPVGLHILSCRQLQGRLL